MDGGERDGEGEAGRRESDGRQDGAKAPGGRDQVVAPLLPTGTGCMDDPKGGKLGRLEAWWALGGVSGGSRSAARAGAIGNPAMEYGFYE
ncbi:hypothetical protein NL676_008240 [Syzygium grande]|nr:hypothetical protein NL676_008240 [Syzygium grande]